MFPIAFDGRREEYALQDIIDRLRSLMYMAFKSVMEADPDFVDFALARKLFINEDGTPYGAAMYGLFLRRVPHHATFLLFNAMQAGARRTQPVDQLPGDASQPLQRRHALGHMMAILGKAPRFVAHAESDDDGADDNERGHGADAEIQEEDTQPLEQPMIAPIKEAVPEPIQSPPPRTTLKGAFLAGLMDLPALIRIVAFIGHPHHGKTPSVDCSSRRRTWSTASASRAP